MDNIYDNFDKMIEDTKRHIVEEGFNLLPYDKPHLGKMGQIGWICEKTNKEWHIDLIDFRNYLFSLEDKNYANTLRQAFRTAEGRKNLVNSLR